VEGSRCGGSDGDDCGGNNDDVDGGSLEVGNGIDVDNDDESIMTGIISKQTTIPS
jgi:hypothetical protein